MITKFQKEDNGLVLRYAFWPRIVAIAVAIAVLFVSYWQVRDNLFSFNPFSLVAFASFGIFVYLIQHKRSVECHIESSRKRIRFVRRNLFHTEVEIVPFEKILELRKTTSYDSENDTDHFLKIVVEGNTYLIYRNDSELKVDEVAMAVSQEIQIPVTTFGAKQTVVHNPDSKVIEALPPLLKSLPNEFPSDSGLVTVRRVQMKEEGHTLIIRTQPSWGATLAFAFTAFFLCLLAWQYLFLRTLEFVRTDSVGIVCTERVRFAGLAKLEVRQRNLGYIVDARFDEGEDVNVIQLINSDSEELTISGFRKDDFDSVEVFIEDEHLTSLELHQEFEPISLVWFVPLIFIVGYFLVGRHISKLILDKKSGLISIEYKVFGFKKQETVQFSTLQSMDCVESAEGRFLSMTVAGKKLKLGIVNKAQDLGFLADYVLED